MAPFVVSAPCVQVRWLVAIARRGAVASRAPFGFVFAYQRICLTKFKNPCPARQPFWPALFG